MTPPRRAFSLVELMIVVAIIGILAAIAIPNVISMQLRARRSEVPVAVDGIRTAQTAYASGFDAFISAEVAPRPDDQLDKQLVPWVGDQDWTAMGFRPDGDLRGNYQVIAGATDYTVIAHSDVDNDDTIAVMTATSSVEGAIVGSVSVW